MGFCKYGNTKVIGSGTYFICSVTNYPCKFARWCPTSLVYKPNANFNSCNVKIRQDKNSLKMVKEPEPLEVIKEEIVEDVPVVEENILNDFFMNDDTNEEEVVVPQKVSKRRKKASSL